MEKNCLVSIIMVSKSDLEVMREAEKVLREFGISCELRGIYDLTDTSQLLL